ncbi:unnamed protein product [Vitrella brassicaformis CCMP3155]|uniref:UV excision repair protein RAD23 n=2 Tax=Vitrella brassicaformis TaxID=1169539 RepID=A0A0G4F6G8_VITBC|nr:unnamed protein product [Vitrella brassicaformis CCMP3155]|mmetsp:Transcript_8129/g.23077  ORF Transcript_8129/g.23077 Transcript_8129/m.23077 type:complete len:416 (+) Transcript_8129:107-1354(+)|eukprot:CEM08008.1 unnamed protein product [Vitrella brassicaformis CCMP3155]
MKLKVKSLKDKDPKEVDVEPSDSIRTLKDKIQGVWPEMEADVMKVICSGKILSDNQKISDYQIEENTTLVIMCQKKPAPAGQSPSQPAAAGTTGAAAPPAAAPAANSTTPASTAPAAPPAAPQAPSTETSAQQPAQQPTEQQQQQTAGTTEGAGGDAGTSYDQAASALITGQNLESAIQNIVDMGFDRAQVQLAMRAAFNNPDRAVEYLMTGIPGGAQPQAPPPAPAGTAVPPAAAMTGAGGQQAPPATMGQQQQQQQQPPPAMGGQQQPGEGQGGPLAALRNYPQFNQLRALVQSQPESLNQILQSISVQNPELMTLIQQHPEEFVRILQEPVGPQPPQVITVQLTPEDDQAVQRLEALGFSRHAAAEAYISCDKNEELAANYLFENMNDIMEEEQPQQQPPGQGGQGGAPGGQ